MSNQPAFNPTFNQEFCTALEVRLGTVLVLCGKEELRGFWCDGISSSPDIPSMADKKSVNDHRQLVTKAWIGKNGQDEYELTMVFGQYSLRRYARGTSMIDCIPAENTMDWVEIDVKNKKITVYLQ